MDDLFLCVHARARTSGSFPKSRNCEIPRRLSKQRFVCTYRSVLPLLVQLHILYIRDTHTNEITCRKNILGPSNCHSVRTVFILWSFHAHSGQRIRRSFVLVGALLGESQRLTDVSKINDGNRRLMVHLTVSGIAASLEKGRRFHVEVTLFQSTNSLLFIKIDPLFVPRKIGQATTESVGSRCGRQAHSFAHSTHIKRHANNKSLG